MSKLSPQKLQELTRNRRLLGRVFRAGDKNFVDALKTALFM
jgi:hypothetical protein